jgi:hypothetical protein
MTHDSILYQVSGNKCQIITLFGELKTHNQLIDKSQSEPHKKTYTT